MTGSELLVFTESLLDNSTIDNDLFYILANVAKTRIEEERNWKILETEQTDTASVGDTFESMKDLPDDFGNDIALYLADTPVWYQPVPYARRYLYKDSSRRYYIDLASDQYALTGKTSSTQTIHLVYRKVSETITSTVEWDFPSRFHALLGFLVAEMHKAGVDYDQTNALQAVQTRADAKALWEAMMLWDDNLRLRELNNQYSGLGATDEDGLPIGSPTDVDLGSL